MSLLDIWAFGILAVVLGVLGAMIRLEWILAFLVVTIPFNFARPLPGNIPLVLETFKLLALGPFFKDVVLGGRKWPRSRYWIPIVILLALVGVSAIRALNVPFYTRSAVRFTGNVALFVVALHVMRNRESMRRVAAAIVWPAAFVALYGLYQYAIGDYGALYWWVNGNFSTEFVPGRGSAEWRDRIGSFLGNENEFGVYMNICIAFLLPRLYSREVSGLGKLASWAGVSLFSLCVLLSYSRGAWVSFAAMLLLFAVLALRRMGAKALLAIAALVVGVTLLVSVGPLHDIVVGRSEGAAEMMDSRQEMWALAGGLFLANPVWGIGFANFAPTIAAIWDAPDTVFMGVDPHNIYLNVLANLGLVGFIAFASILVGAWIGSLRRSLRRDRGDDLITVALPCALTAILIHGFVDEPLFQAHVSYLSWLIFAMVEASRRLAGPPHLPAENPVQ